MTKSKAFIVIAVLLAFVSVFGAWTDDNNAEIRYADAVLSSPYASEVVTYTRKQTAGPVNTDGNCPFYQPLSDLPDSCGSVAGAEIVAFYDKYFPNLIPDWTSYYETNGKYKNQDSVYVPALIRELYALMRINVNAAGVSRTDFLNGLTSYINGKGHQVNYQSVMSGKTIDFSLCKNAIENNKVIVLFSRATSVYDISAGSGQDTITSTAISGPHIMVVYGFVHIDYYNAGNIFRNDTYLNVAVGYSTHKTAYYKINSTTTEAAYIVNIQ